MALLAKLMKGRALKKTDINQPLVDKEMSEKLFADSFADLLPIRHYAGDGLFYFRDMTQFGGALRIQPISLEASTKERQNQVFKDVQYAIKHGIPNEYDDVWLSQLFIVKKQAPNEVVSAIIEHCANSSKDALKSEFTQHYLKEVEQHLSDLSNANGAFIDNNTGNPWSLSQLDIYLCFWQEFTPNKMSIKQALSNNQVINQGLIQTKEVLERIEHAFEQAGLRTFRLGAKDYINFIATFFHQDTIDYQADPLNVLEEDFSQIALSNTDISVDKGIWQFTHKHKDRFSVYLPLESITGDLRLGHLTAEQQDKLSLIDRLPYNSIWSQTTIHIHQDLAEESLTKIVNQSISKGDADDAISVNRQTAVDVRANLHNDPIYRFAAGIYINVGSYQEIDGCIRKVKSILGARQLEVLDLNLNPLAQDDFIRSLPFAFNYKIDQRFFRKRARLQALSDISKLTPFYGRSTGTGSYGLLSYNRGGEPLSFDPIADRVKNAFGLIVGPMGSGKSAFAIYFIMQMIAVYKPRIFIIEKGDSFGLLLKHCESLNLTTHRVAIKADSRDIKLSPFAEAIELLKEPEEVTVHQDDSDEDQITRDLLGELLIIGRLMITGGEKKEEEKFERSDETTLADAIKLAAKRTQENGRTITLTEGVIFALEELASDENNLDSETERIRKMAKAMKTFINTDFSNAIFNKEGKLFPEVDITQLDVGILGDEGYQDKLAVAFIALMMNINALVEAKQFEDRPTVILVDEAHLITKNPLLSPYVVKIAKMWRKLGAWLWLATQSLDDFPEESQQMLKVMEWWICLSMSKAEAQELSRFKELTDEQLQLVLSASKSKGQYTEGVVLSDRIDSLFRNVPPALCLALAMTEKDEKSERRDLMRKHNCSELEAAYMIAKKISENRKGQGL